MWQFSFTFSSYFMEQVIKYREMSVKFGVTPKLNEADKMKE